EVRYTDRVLAFPRFLALNESSDGVTDVTLPQPELISGMVGGDTNSGRNPMPAVRWHTPPQDIAVWVTQASRSQLEGELFHFGEQPRKMAEELRLLRPGRYRAELLHDGRAIGPVVRPLEVNGPLATVSFELPSQKLCVLRVAPERTPRN